MNAFARLTALLILVPLAVYPAAGRAHAFGPPDPVRVPVAARAIHRGDVLTEADITFESRQLARGISVDTTVAPGWVARRVINRGEILRAPAVQKPQVVAANGALAIAWSNGAVAISLRGIASRSAAVGEQISARLPDGRRLDVIVTGPGTARIP